MMFVMISQEAWIIRIGHMQCLMKKMVFHSQICKYFPEDPESWSDDMSFSDDESEAQFSSTDGESGEEILGSYDRTPA